MTISSVSSLLNTYQTDVQSAWKQRAQDFKALQSALQTGDLSGAQQAFAAVQTDQQNASQTTQASSASSQNTQGAQDFQSLQSALGSGDISGAQQAFASLKQDMQGTSRAGHYHHHHAASASSTTQATDASSASSQNSQGTKDFQLLQSALSSGDLSGAQQAFAALQTDLQSAGQTGRHHHQSSGSVSSATQAASATASSGTTPAVGSALDVQA